MKTARKATKQDELAPPLTRQKIC